jgi:hypothetical protein
MNSPIVVSFGNRAHPVERRAAARHEQARQKSSRRAEKSAAGTRDRVFSMLQPHQRILILRV